MHQILALWLQLHILGKRPVPGSGRGPSLALPRRGLPRERAEICSDCSEWERQLLLQFTCFGICFFLVLFPLPIGGDTLCSLLSLKLPAILSRRSLQGSGASAPPSSSRYYRAPEVGPAAALLSLQPDLISRSGNGRQRS